VYKGEISRTAGFQEEGHRKETTLSTIGKRSLKARGLPLTEAGPDHPIYKRGLIIGGVSTSPSSTSGSEEKKVQSKKDQPKDGALPPEVSKEEAERLFQESLPEFLEGMKASALHQWKGSPSEKTEDTEDE
jgi:hypothetical protein